MRTSLARKENVRIQAKWPKDRNKFSPRTQKNGHTRARLPNCRKSFSLGNLPPKHPNLNRRVTPLQYFGEGPGEGLDARPYTHLTHNNPCYPIFKLHLNSPPYASGAFSEKPDFIGQKIFPFPIGLSNKTDYARRSIP